MIVKTYYQDGRTDAFDTANLTDASMYRARKRRHQLVARPLRCHVR